MFSSKNWIRCWILHSFEKIVQRRKRVPRIDNLLKTKTMCGSCLLAFRSIDFKSTSKKKLNTGNPRLRYQYRAKQMFISRLQLKHWQCVSETETTNISLSLFTFNGFSVGIFNRVSEKPKWAVMKTWWERSTARWRSTVFSKGQEVCADYFVQRIFMEKTEQIKTKK